GRLLGCASRPRPGAGARGPDGRGQGGLREVHRGGGPDRGSSDQEGDRGLPAPPGEFVVQIWVDADACPQVIKEILFRAAERAQIVTTLVANTLLRTPPSPFIRTIRVPRG